MKYITLILSFLLLSSTLSAEDKKGTVELATGFGKYFYDDSRLDDPSMGVLAIGYNLSEDWQAEFLWSNVDTEINSTNEQLKTDWMAVRGLYHFSRSKNINPYFSIGLGQIDAFKGEQQLVLGAGLKGALGERSFWRVEANFHSDESDTSVLAMIGYRFGAKGHSTMKPKDSDGDGVMDNVDACPNTPPGTKVDETGCKEKTMLDSDKDGVYDHLDICPDTPANALVDASGCQKELLKEVSVTLNINFDTDKSEVKSEYLSEIESLAQFMTQYAGTEVVIEGHTDSQGKAAYNQNLSQRRADAVMAILTSDYGISASRAEAKGYGEANPIADNNTAEGRKENRRVVAVINQQVKEKQWK